MVNHQSELGLDSKTGGSTHFQDITNFVTPPRNSMNGIHQSTEFGQAAHDSLPKQTQMHIMHGTVHEGSLQDTRMKQGGTGLGVFNIASFGAEAMPSADTHIQTQQVQAHGQHHEGNVASESLQSTGPAQNFGLEVGTHTSDAQRSVYNNAEGHSYYLPSVQPSDSQTSYQPHSGPFEDPVAAQIMQEQAHANNMQIKTEAASSEEKHQVRSYPSSPLSRKQMPQQLEAGGLVRMMGLAGGRHLPSHRSSHSWGQAGDFMSGNPNRDVPVHNHDSAPVSPSDGINPGSVPFTYYYTQPRHDAVINADMFARSCAPSVRSTSPSASMASTSMVSISPLGSAPLNHDGSFASHDTSFDNLSNAASGSFSRESSTCEDVFSLDLGFAHSPRMSKQKKKLRNIDRKAICEHAVAHPTAKQDEIANAFGIERSTVSKILKHKEKWLAIKPGSDAARIAKHRDVKFPEVERILIERLKKIGEPIRDSFIRDEALRIAEDLEIGEDKFKASGGWIENFRKRNSIHKPSADAARMTPGAAETVRQTTPSPSRGDVPLAPRPTLACTSGSVSPANVADGSAGKLQSQPSRRQPARGHSGKGTPQKRGRDDQANPQVISSMSPLSHDMAQMQFQNVVSPQQVPTAMFLEDTSNPCHPGMPEIMQNCGALYMTRDDAGLTHPMEGGDQERKRRRADPEAPSNQAANALGAPIEFQLPLSQGVGPGTSAQLSTPPDQGEIKAHKGTPPRTRSVAQHGESSSRGRPRRGTGRLSNANHAPQTPSPLSVPPADTGSETSSNGCIATEVESVPALIASAKDVQRLVGEIFKHEANLPTESTQHLMETLQDLRAEVEQGICRLRNRGSPFTAAVASGSGPGFAWDSAPQPVAQVDGEDLAVTRAHQ